MPERPGFEEKEFETLANSSFILQSSIKPGAVVMFSPGQALEKDLGFDFSVQLDPTSTTYRLLFGSFPGTPRTVGYPRANPPGMPRIHGVVNTFIQYKRPYYLRANHRQSVWRGRPFLRFDVRSTRRVNGQSVTDHSQLSALCDLADNNPDVKVRYACPSVWTSEDLYSQHADHTLVERSSFTDPRNLYHDRMNPTSGWHNYWTFTPDSPWNGRPNPDGPLRDAQTGEDFLTELSRESTRPSKAKFQHEVAEIYSKSSERLKSSNFFQQPSDYQQGTKGDAVIKARESVNEHFVEPFRDPRWLLSKAAGSTGIVRPPSRDDIFAIETAVDVAATARELGLVWMSATI